MNVETLTFPLLNQSTGKMESSSTARIPSKITKSTQKEADKLVKSLHKCGFRSILSVLPHIQMNLFLSLWCSLLKQFLLSWGMKTLNNTIVKGFNQMTPPAWTITVALDMSKAFDTINCHRMHTNIQHLHDETLHFQYTSTYSSTPHNTNRKHHIHYTTYLNIPRLKNNIFNNTPG